MTPIAMITAIAEAIKEIAITARSPAGERILMQWMDQTDAFNTRVEKVWETLTKRFDG